MTSLATAIPPNTESLNYLVLGLATCFIKKDGEVIPVQVIEPLPSATLETIVAGIPTSYEFAFATDFHAVIQGERLIRPGLGNLQVQLQRQSRIRQQKRMAQAPRLWL